jgi:GNAT superfamily N-acetyltransferase
MFCLCKPAAYVAAAMQPAVGVVNVTLMRASASIAAATDCKPGTPFAMITNMAVSPAVRRQGVAHQLMQVCVAGTLCLYLHFHFHFQSGAVTARCRAQNMSFIALQVHLQWE